MKSNQTDIENRHYTISRNGPFILFTFMLTIQSLIVTSKVNKMASSIKYAQRRSISFCYAIIDASADKYLIVKYNQGNNTAMLKDVRAALLSWMKKKEQFNSNEAAAMTYQLVHTQKTEDKKYHFFF